MEYWLIVSMATTGGRGVGGRSGNLYWNLEYWLVSLGERGEAILNLYWNLEYWLVSWGGGEAILSLYWN